MLPFLLLLFVALTVFFWTSSEGFQSAKHTVTIPKNIPASLSALPAPSKLSESSDPSDPSDPSDLSSPSSPSDPSAREQPGMLPVAPYEQIGAMSPLPYQDTTLIKANRQQLISALEMIKGFLSFEAQEIAEQSDPNIQLPLNTARSDFYTLQNEVSVLNRNPGIQPTITLSHLQDISANLAYLQEKVRLLGSAGALQGPVYSFTEKEGFINPMGSPSAPSPSSSAPSAPSPSSTASPSAPSPSASTGQLATEADLKTFLAKLEGETRRLAASGTTDPVVQGRVTALTAMRQEVRQILDQLRSGALLSTEVPIMKADLDRAFPILGRPNEPLPQLLRATNLPPGLANLLPSNLQKDPAITREIGTLINKYADTILNGITATFEVTYKPSEGKEKARKKNSTVDQTGFPSVSDLENATQSSFLPTTSERPVTDRLAPLPQDAGRGPSHFNWKERARQIEDQVRRRGLKSADFGIMPRDQRVSEEFSWKGYARMICTRLQATMDPGLPETCGCPPMDWKGWRN